MVGTLHIVATPIGNLEDITLRALRVLREVDIIAAEDTRVTRKLLSRYDIHTPLVSYHQHSRGRRAEEIVDMLREGKRVALVSDAGTPGISDPGHELIGMCVSEAIPMDVVPGPTAIVAALVLSGLPTTHFAFDGFPPRKESERAAFFRSLRQERRTVCLYEAPLRLEKTLQTMLAELGDRRVVVVREVTKRFEEVLRGTVTEAIERFARKKPRGEIVIVIEGAPPDDVSQSPAEGADLKTRLAELIEAGLTERDAIRQCMIEYKLPKRVVYEAAIRLKAGQEPSGAPET